MFVTITLNPAIDASVTVKGPLRINSIQTIVGMSRTPGGKGINVAKVIAANGCKVVAGGLVGGGEAAWFESELEKAGIDCHFMKVAGETRENTMVSDSSGREIKLNRPGYPDLKFDFAKIQQYCLGLVKNAMVVILSGSLPARFPPETYAMLIRLFHKAGKTVVFDASGSPLLLGLKEKPEVIKPNMQEFQQCCGKLFNRNTGDTIRRLQEKHEVVIVSDGSSGAYFCDSSILLHAVPPKVPVVDTTGAGDTLLGQFCCDYFPVRRLTKRVATRAVAAGSVAVGMKSTPVPPLGRIKALAKCVAVKEID